MTKTLGANLIRLNLVDLVQSTVDPSVAGVAAAIGSFYLRSGTAQAWLKTGAGNTAWAKLQQSFEWFSVKDFGARGDAATDDTAAVQAAITACGAAGGGVVFFPEGEYRVSQITITSSRVQLRGCGDSSIIRWTWNAATVAGSMITISGGINSIRLEGLQFNGAGLTNPAASRLNHLVAVGTGASALTAVSVLRCLFTGMVANSGDGVHVLGAAGNLVQRLWVKQNRFDGCSRFGVGIEQGLNYAWVNENFFTNCETDVALVATAALTCTGIEIVNNEIVHTGATRHALRIEGNSGAVYSGVVVAENVILGGFVSLTNLIYLTFTNNVITGGAFASADAVVRAFGSFTLGVIFGNTIARDSGASVGPCVTVERASGASPTLFRVGRNVFANDTTGANFITLVDVTVFSVGGNVCRSLDATGTVYGIDVQAVAVAVTDALIGPGNVFSAAASSLDACVRLLVNGSSITNISVTGNQGDNCDFGVRLEDAGAGSFNGQLLIGSNNFNAATGDIQEVGTTPVVRIGFNAGLVGAQLFRGAGSPEGVVTARISSVYLRSDGGQATVLYYKESGTGNTGWVAVGGWPLVFGAQDLGTAATALFMGPGWIAAANATEMQVAITRPGILRNLRVNVKTAGTDNQTITFTVRKNGVDTAIVATISNTATGLVSDLVNTTTVVAGDLISIKVTKAAIVAAGQTFVAASLEIV